MVPTFQFQFRYHREQSNFSSLSHLSTISENLELVIIPIYISELIMSSYKGKQSSSVSSEMCNLVEILNQFKDDITKVLDKRLDKLERKFNDMLRLSKKTTSAADNITSQSGKHKVI